MRNIIVVGYFPNHLELLSQLHDRAGQEVRWFDDPGKGVDSMNLFTTIVVVPQAIATVFSTIIPAHGLVTTIVQVVTNQDALTRVLELEQHQVSPVRTVTILMTHFCDLELAVQTCLEEIQ